MAPTQTIITRAEAKALKLTRYFSGKACPKGHVSDRSTSSSGCCECSREKDKRRDRRSEPSFGKNRAAYHKQRASTPEGKLANRRAALKYNYNLSFEEYEKLIADQGNQCACCKVPFDKSSKVTNPHVDHNHSTGKVRGILCHDCNIGLSKAKEDVTILQSWIRYIRRDHAS